MITIRSEAEIERMYTANQLVSDVLAQLESAVAPGVTTWDLDVLAERLVREGGAVPAFKGYRGYPATLCASINDEVVHGIPSPARVLKTGDIISLDVGVKLDGYFGDSAVTVAVGAIATWLGRRQPAVVQAPVHGLADLSASLDGNSPPLG